MKIKNIAYVVLSIAIISACVYIFGFSKETQKSMKDTMKSAKGDMKDNFESAKKSMNIGQDKFVIKIKDQEQPTEKEQFVVKMKNQLDSIDVELKNQEEKIKGLNGNMQISAKKQWQDLKENRDKALEKLKEINDSTEEKWIDLKLDVTDAFAKLENS